MKNKMKFYRTYCRKMMRWDFLRDIRNKGKLSTREHWEYLEVDGWLDGAHEAIKVFGFIDEFDQLYPKLLAEEKQKINGK